MDVTLIEDAAGLESLREEWPALTAGVPFRRLEWLGNWWRHFGACAESGGASRLATLAVRDPDGSLVAIAPWYWSRTLSGGGVIRFLASGVVCSDYMSLPCRPGREADAARALVQWLTALSAHWDLIELSGVDSDDAMVVELGRQLAAAGHRVHQSAGPNCWRLPLPATWDLYLAGVTGSKRQSVRRLIRRMFDTRRAVLRTVESEDQWNEIFSTFRGLHQLRRQSLGQAGCFSNPQFAAFLCDAGRELWRARRLELLVLEIDGRPAAAECNLLGEDRIVYYYQTGIDPAQLGESPGHLIACARIQRAILNGYSAIDFLRGDERYKREWNAQPRTSIELRIVGRRAGAELRHAAWLWRHRARNVAKRGWTIAGRLGRHGQSPRSAAPTAGDATPPCPTAAAT